MGYTNVREVQTSEGTGYYMTNKAGSGAVYLPPNAGSATAVVGMYPGMGANWQSPQSGTGNYSDYINGTVLAGGAPSGTILVFADRYGGTTPATVPDVVNTALGSGVGITDVGVMTFSGSGQSGMLAAGIVASEHDNLNVKVINCDAYTHTYIQQLMTHTPGSTGSNALSQRQHNGMTAMQNGKVTVYNYIPDTHVSYEKYDEMVNDINFMANNGVNTVLVTGKSQSHGAYRVSILNNNGVEWLAGRGKIGTDDFVKVQRYDAATKQWVDVDMNSGEYSLNVVDLGSNIIDPSAYKETTYSLDTSSGNNSKLASDLGLVMNAMNDLSGTIKNTTFDKATNGCASTVPVVGLMYDSQNYLMGVSSTLADNIGKESAVIANIAQAIYNMDSQLTQNTNGINGQVAGTQVNEALSKILSTDISIPFASFASPISTEKVTQGNAGKLVMSDLKAMLNGGNLSGPLANSFETDNAAAQKTIDSIKSFQQTIASNTSLQGDIWKEVNAKLDQYNGLLDKRIASNDKLKSAYEKAIKLLEDYMEDYDELDDAKIPELKAQVQQLKADIAALQAKIDEMKEVCSTDKEGHTSCTMVHVYSDAARAEFAEQIKQNEALIEELNQEIAKLEGLWEKVNEASDIINGAIDEIKGDYAKGVQDMAVASPDAVLDSTNTDLGATANNNQTGTQQTEQGAANQGTGSWDNGAYSTSNSGGSGYGGGGGGGYSGGGGGGYSGGGISAAPTKTQDTTTPKTDTESSEGILPFKLADIDKKPEETQPQQETPKQTEPTVINNTKQTGGGARPYRKSSLAAREPSPIPVETNVEDIVAEEIIEEPVSETPLVASTPTLQEIIHEPQNEQVVTLSQPNLVEQPTSTNNTGSLLKAGGVLLGVGLTAGAVASAIRESQKSEQESSDIYEGEKDYRYKSTDEDYF